MIRRHAFFTLALVLVTQFAAPAKAYSTGGAGIQSCGTWTADRRDLNSILTIQAESWVMGFVSGAAVFGPNYDPFNGTDAQGVWAWIDNYCNANPLDKIIDAGGAFVKFHPD